MRVDTQTILTIDDAVITRSQRFSVRHTADASGHLLHHQHHQVLLFKLLLTTTNRTTPILNSISLVLACNLTKNRTFYFFYFYFYFFFWMNE